MLSNERKLEIYAERLWRLALDLAMQASMGGKERRGIAIVAEETRNCANKLYRLIENEDNEIIRRSINDALLQLQALSVNGWLEMLRVYNGFAPSEKIANPIAVILEEIRNVTNDIRRLFGIADAYASLPQPELMHESSISPVKLFLIQASIGGIPFVENTSYVQEVIAYVNGDCSFGIHEGYIRMRGEKIPVIDCYSRFGLNQPESLDTAGRQCALIVKTDWEKSPSLYAVPIDGLPLTFGFFSRFAGGQTVGSRSDIFTNDYIRACWDTTDGGQMLFLDWKTLA